MNCRMVATVILTNLMILTSISTTVLSLDGWDTAVPSSQVPVPAPLSLPSFTNVSPAAGLAGNAGNYYAWGDYDNDGLQDLLVGGTALYRNDGPPGWGFTSVTVAANISYPGGHLVNTGVWADFNNDGYLDFFAAGGGWSTDAKAPGDTLWVNTGPSGSWTFEDHTDLTPGLDDFLPSVTVGIGDLDNDGFVDIYVGNYENGSMMQYFPDRLWYNNGNLTFTNATTSSGIGAMSAAPARSVLIQDFDNDGWQDIYVGNYRLKRNYMFVNDRDGTFTERAVELGIAGVGRTSSGGPNGDLYGHTIGAAYADLNNDGRMDMFVANLAHKDPDRGRFCDDSKLYLSNGPPGWNFTDIRNGSGIPIKKVGGVQGGLYDDENFANAAWADFDNDGYIDLWVPQVYDNWWMYAYLYRNLGNNTFVNVSGTLGIDVVNTYGGAWADYDNDGDMDLVTGGQFTAGHPSRIHLFNNGGGTGNHWLGVNLTGTKSNKAALGARVVATIGNKHLTRFVEGGMGAHGSQSSLHPMFGLGMNTSIDRLEIFWPNGTYTRLDSVSVDRYIEVTEDDGGLIVTGLTINPTQALEDASISFSGTVSGPAGYAYSWDYDGDGTWDENYTTTITPKTHSFDLAGIYHPTLYVFDPVAKIGVFKTGTLNILNQQPVMNLVVPASVKEDDVVVFNASGTTDMTFDKAHMLYNFSFGDGNATGFQSLDMMSHIYNMSGDYKTTVTAKDYDNSMGSANVTITVANVIPTVNGTANVTSIPEEGTVTFNATGNDTPSDMARGLQFRWTFGDGSNTSWSDNASTVHKYMFTGNRTSTIEVRDDDGAIGTAVVNISVGMVVPSVAITRGGGSALEDEFLDFDGSANDTAGDLATGLLYKWDWGDGDATDWQKETASAHSFMAAGIFTVTLTSKDDGGSIGNASVTVNVSNLAPIATIMEYTEIGDEGSTGFEFTGDGQDTPSDMAKGLMSMWDFGDGNATEWSADPTATHVYEISGSYDISFMVRDDDNATAEAIAAVEVENIVPTVEITSPDPSGKGSFFEDEIVPFQGKGTDAPFDQALLVPVWTISGPIHEWTAEGWEVNMSFGEIGDFKATFKVTDIDGATATASVEFEVKNVLPKIESAIVTELELEIDDHFNYSAVATDTPSDIDGLVYEWDMGDGIRFSRANGTYGYEEEGTYTVTLSVTDAHGGKDTRSFEVRVKGPSCCGPEPGPTPERTLNWTIIMLGIGTAIAVIGIIVLVFLYSRGMPPFVRHVYIAPEVAEVEPPKKKTKKKVVKKE